MLAAAYRYICFSMTVSPINFTASCRSGPCTSGRLDCCRRV